LEKIIRNFPQKDRKKKRAQEETQKNTDHLIFSLLWTTSRNEASLSNSPYQK